MCGKRMRLAGERLVVSQLETSSFHSCDEREGTRAKTCSGRLVPWDRPRPGIPWRSGAALQPEQSADRRAPGPGPGTTDAPWDCRGT